MMKGLFIPAALIVILLGLTNCKRNNSDILYDRKYIDEIKEARQEVFFFLSRNLIPGGSFAIAGEGKIIYSEGMGLASKDLEVPVTRQTKFRIGQLSEIFTAAIYYKMVENGILHPDSTVRSYFPEFPEKQYKLPVRYLLSHTSGLREPTSKENDTPGLNLSLENGINFFMKDSLLVQPGTVQIPSMYNYNLLGAIMEKAAKKSFSSILEEYITDTLSLNNTQVDNPFITIKGRSDFFDHNIVAQVVHATTRDLRFRAPSEGMLSNAEDLVKFGNALLSSGYFSGELKKSMFEPVTLPNGVTSNLNNGWVQFRDSSGRKVCGKSGTVTGGGAAILIYPDEKLVVACTTNAGTDLEDYPVFEMAGHFLPEKDEQH